MTSVFEEIEELSTRVDACSSALIPPAEPPPTLVWVSGGLAGAAAPPELVVVVDVALEEKNCSRRLELGLEYRWRRSSVMYTGRLRSFSAVIVPGCVYTVDV